MPADILVRPMNRYSDGALAIRRALGDRCRLSRTTATPRQYKHVINWGSTGNVILRDGVRLYNYPEAINRTTNKLSAFEAMKDKEVRVPETATKLEDNSTDIWLARTILNGSQGRGIVIIRPGDSVPDAPLYVKYVKKNLEYRVHVVDGEVIFVQQKRKRNGAEQNRDQKLIRNHDNGWVFAIENVNIGDDVKQECVKAVAALGLTFGAVDVIVGNADHLPYVLEVNTAPGIASPSLLQAYKNAFLKLTGE